ncbi:MAG: S-layer homology domain-containing protein, partial [Clostridia bacterium]|nr:S-layer homology domain-containing protein [Clostridia bacterium]
DVTRAEFATMLMRAMASAGFGSSDPAGTPFTDLTAASWAISDIRTAYDLGIINGMTETTFEPNNNVTYEQALKMIVCALNYGEQANSIQATVSNMPWYYGYLQTARNLGLVENISVIETKPAKRKEIAQMIYNALDVYMLEKVEVSGGGNMYMESKQTWLADKLKVTKSRGEVLADETNTIDGSGATARPGQILLTDEVNKTTITVSKNGISTTGLLGKAVDYYYKSDDLGNKSLVLIYSKGGESQSVIIDAENISSITGNYTSGYTISYYESATAVRPISLNVSANPAISFNGELKTNVTANQLNIEGGKLEIIFDGASYSKINVESLETYVVKSVNRTDKYIVDMYRTSGSNTLYIDDEDNQFVINMKNTSGSNISLSNLSQYNVLTVKRGAGVAGRTTLDITVSTKNVSGTIKAKDTDMININGTQYPISAYMKRYSGNDLNTFSVGDSCKAYIDKDGKIAYMIKSASSSTYYGYIADAGKGNDDVLKFAIISDKTTKVGSPYISGANKITIDGIAYTDPNLALAKLKESAELNTANIDGFTAQAGKVLYSQLVKYTINSAGEISAIDTAVISTEEDPADETVFKPFAVTRDAQDKMQYKASSYDFVGENNSKFRINSSTKVFLVPLDRYDFDLYGRKSSSFFKDGIKYVVEPYDVSGSLNIAGAVIVYQTAETEAKIEYNTPLFVISAISQSTNSDGDSCDKVTGYQISTSGTVTEKTVYTTGVGVISGKYSVGDVIMYVADSKGYLVDDSATTGTKFKQLLNVKSFANGFEHVGNNKYNTVAYNCELYAGLLIGADVDGTTQMFDIAMTNNPADCGTAQAYSMSANSSVKYFVYDSTKTSDSDKLTQQDALDLTAFASYNDTIQSGTPNATKMFVYKYNNVVRMIMIIK